MALHKHSSLLNGLLHHNINVLIINEVFSNEIKGFLINALAYLYFVHFYLINILNINPQTCLSFYVLKHCISIHINIICLIMLR